MTDREIRINVYDGTKIGHANLSFYQDGEHQYTVGANVRLDVPQLALPQLLPFEPDDGIYRDESAYHLAAIAEGTVTSAAVPVTANRYDALLNAARSLENETFNYDLFNDACIELVEAFYDATGHPGEFGDLFAAEDRSGALVWSRVPVSDDSPFSVWPDDVAPYTPPEPIVPDPPPGPTPIVFAALPDPPMLSASVAPSDPTEGSPAVAPEIESESEDLQKPHPILFLGFEADELIEATYDPGPIGLEMAPFGFAEIDNEDKEPLELGSTERLEDESNTLSFGRELVTVDESDAHGDRPAELSLSSAADAPLSETLEETGLSFGVDLTTDEFRFADTGDEQKLTFGEDFDDIDLVAALAEPVEPSSFGVGLSSGATPEGHTSGESNDFYDFFL